MDRAEGIELSRFASSDVGRRRNTASSTSAAATYSHGEERYRPAQGQNEAPDLDPDVLWAVEFLGSAGATDSSPWVRDLTGCLQNTGRHP